ncbi:MAG: hypothetical protein K2X53_03940 [Alphaproteobacteria bacterium]|nr:hypothetical protein [Alphaproteobacteria bacterium]
MLRLKLSILFFLLTVSLQASEESFWKYSLFNQEDGSGLMETPKNSTKITSYDQGNCLHLQGILVSDSLEWALWINGGKLLKSAQKSNLLVEHLSRDQATFRWTLEDKTHAFTLHLHESYHVSTQTVTKGGCS